MDLNFFHLSALSLTLYQGLIFPQETRWLLQQQKATVSKSRGEKEISLAHVSLPGNVPFSSHWTGLGHISTPSLQGGLEIEYGDFQLFLEHEEDYAGKKLG